MARKGPDLKYLLLIEDDEVGDLFFGPFATEGKAQQEGEKFERAGADAWSVHELQPGSYAVEWRRIVREHRASVSDEKP